MYLEIKVEMKALASSFSDRIGHSSADETKIYNFNMVLKIA